VISVSDIEYIFINSKTDKQDTVNVINMLNEGLSVPFISRYRKERTGNMDEESVNLINNFFNFIKELNLRKNTILKSVEQQDLLTDELKNKIEKCYSLSELEDIYLPFKPKKRTKAVIGKEKGLEPLSVLILDPSIKDSAEDLALNFLSTEKGVGSTDEALEWAGYIIAEKFSEDIRLRKKLRDHLKKSGMLNSVVRKEFKNKRSKFEQYYDFSESVLKIPSHRILAIFRGENEGVLKKKIVADMEKFYNISGAILFSSEHPRYSLLKEIYFDSIKRLIFPSIENEILKDLKKEADEKAISVFASNLENILLSPPAGNRTVLALDPGFRTGCKIAILDKTGKYIYNTTIYPTKPKEDIAASAEVVKKLIDKYKVEAVVIGDGTASRETYDFIKKIVDENIIVSVISESGASIYSASKTGREEFPDLDVTVRGAISIGRRFQDPLSELVKLDPKSIGVGQYQHDVDQKFLSEKLDIVVSSVVNRVGVDLNNSSAYLLRYVAGIGTALSKKIVEYRDKNGMFKKREELKKVEKFGDKSFMQSAGFMRITGGNNILDSTGIHPESYSVVEMISKDMDIEIEELIGNSKILSGIKIEKYISEDAGKFTVNDIIEELKKPGRDPRKSFEPVKFDDSVRTIDDLEIGMILNGKVTNVTNFGAFIDIGVHQDGLAHISELSDKFVKDPSDILSVGDRVKARILSVDKELKRIGLSLKENF